MANTQRTSSITRTTPCFTQRRVVLLSSNTGATLFCSNSLNGRNKGDAVEISAERRHSSVSWGTGLVSCVDLVSCSCKKAEYRNLTEDFALQISLLVCARAVLIRGHGVGTVFFVGVGWGCMIIPFLRHLYSLFPRRA